MAQTYLDEELVVVVLCLPYGECLPEELELYDHLPGEPAPLHDLLPVHQSKSVSVVFAIVALKILRINLFRKKGVHSFLGL